MSNRPSVVIDKRDGLGLISLNRPEVINAVNHAMYCTILGALQDWANDTSVRAVVLTGAGTRGLCAGGDVAIFHDDGLNGRTGPDSLSGRLFRTAYSLSACIARYPKPYIAIMDGIVLGGGVGLSAHGSHRIVTEQSSVGMPEVSIGFAPDVGSTYLLSRAPGEIGTHMALTAGRVNAADAIAAGFADCYVPSRQLPSLLNALATSEPEIAIARYAEEAAPSEIASHREWIDSCYRSDTVEEILEALYSAHSPAARRLAAEIAAKSPVALKVTLRALRSARNFTIEEALDQEYRVSVAALATHDLVEGIRAQVIDKDHTPQWCPVALTEVTPAQVDAYFVPLGENELKLSPSKDKPILNRTGLEVAIAS
ncbi:enoyl-CoA hydratase/isomerase family protein [Nocardia sp. CA-107356]|uniref:enoyl-CoA hydratase/isomerase family protein n=1 Tax=Nocardia sp. CA-107356 TaxID=3239972 RepID=UPI003D8C5CED